MPSPVVESCPASRQNHNRHATRTSRRHEHTTCTAILHPRRRGRPRSPHNRRTGADEIIEPAGTGRPTQPIVPPLPSDIKPTQHNHSLRHHHRFLRAATTTEPLRGTQPAAHALACPAEPHPGHLTQQHPAAETRSSRRATPRRQPLTSGPAHRSSTSPARLRRPATSTTWPRPPPSRDTSAAIYDAERTDLAGP